MATAATGEGKTPLNLAVIGFGNMATGLIRQALALGRVRIVAVHDIDPEVMQQRTAEFGGEAVPDIRDLVHRSDVEAFLVASPGLYHCENVLAIAPAGKPIYSEKPLCTTVARCNEMIETCRAHGAKLFVGQVLRLMPMFWKSHEIIESGELGTPRACSVTRAGNAALFRTAWRTRKEESGGTLMEVNSHELDYMIFLLGDPDTVYAQGCNITGRCDYEDTMFVQIHFKNGGIGMLHSSQASPIGEYRVHIQCSKGNMVHGGFGGELRYQAFDAKEPTIIKAADLADQPDAIDWELTSFFDWAQYDTPPLFTGETGRANVAVAEAAYRSSASGKPETVSLP